MSFIILVEHFIHAQTQIKQVQSTALALPALNSH